MILKGQLALVTGAAQGIGAAISQALAAEGAKVVMADINADRARSTAAVFVGKGLDCIGDGVDVTQRADVDAFAERITSTVGPISVLVNNAGIGVNMPIADAAAPKVWDDTIAVNLTGAFNVSALPAGAEANSRIDRQYLIRCGLH